MGTQGGAGNPPAHLLLSSPSMLAALAPAASWCISRDWGCRGVQAPPPPRTTPKEGGGGLVWGWGCRGVQAPPPPKWRGVGVGLETWLQCPNYPSDHWRRRCGERNSVHDAPPPPPNQKGQYPGVPTRLLHIPKLVHPLTHVLEQPNSVSSLRPLSLSADGLHRHLGPGLLGDLPYLSLSADGLHRHLLAYLGISPTYPFRRMVCTSTWSLLRDLPY